LPLRARDSHRPSRNRTGPTILIIGLVLLAMWRCSGEDPHGGAFLGITAIPLIIIGAAITIAVWAFRPGPDPLRDPFGTGTDVEDSDEVRHN
jgi:hypothetical protein